MYKIGDKVIVKEHHGKFKPGDIVTIVDISLPMKIALIERNNKERTVINFKRIKHLGSNVVYNPINKPEGY